MPALKKARWEVFCQGLATGQQVEKAYINAGFSGNGAEKSSRRLRARPEIASRLAELKGQIAKGLAEITEVAPLQQLICPPIASVEPVPTRKVFVLGNIADRVYRVSVLDDLLQRHIRLIEARAADMKDVPGGETGLLVRKIKVVGTATNRMRGGDGESVVERTEPDVREEYIYDAALAKEIRELTKEAGIEMGQRVEHNDTVVRPGPAVPDVDYDSIPLDVLRRSRDLMQKAQALLIEAPVSEMVAEAVEEITQEPEATDDFTAA